MAHGPLGRALRHAAAPVAALLSLGVAVTVAPSAADAAGYCGTVDTGILSHAAKVTSLPGGAKLKVWHDGRMTLSEVRVPASSALQLRVWTSGALTRSARPTKTLGSHPQGVAIMNAGIFDPNRGSLPAGIQVVDGVVHKAERSPHNAILIGAVGHQLANGSVSLAGHVTAGSHSFRVTGLNWQTLSGGINVYTRPWGSQARPHGPVDVVVANGVVKAVRHSGLGKAPGAGAQILTGTGDAATFLNRLHVGQKVAVSYRPVYDIRGDNVFRVRDAVDHGMPYWLDGRQWAVECNSRNMTHWPRSAMGYDQQGNFFLVVASGPNRTSYGGGATHSEMQYYLHRFGAYNANQLDGDTSSTLGVRRVLGGTVNRVDKANSFYQRPVPNYLAIR